MAAYSTATDLHRSGHDTARSPQTMACQRECQYARTDAEPPGAARAVTTGVTALSSRVSRRRDNRPDYIPISNSRESHASTSSRDNPGCFDNVANTPDHRFNLRRHRRFAARDQLQQPLSSFPSFFVRAGKSPSVPILIAAVHRDSEGERHRAGNETRKAERHSIRGSLRCSQIARAGRRARRLRRSRGHIPSGANGGTDGNAQFRRRRSRPRPA